MKTFMAAAMLAAMAGSALAQDPNRNRMNEPYPEAKQQEFIAPSAQSHVPSPFANRMNVVYGEGSAKELTGGPNPFGNRMNLEWPKAQPKPQPKETEKTPMEPIPRP
jgi:hypothetical protein